MTLTTEVSSAQAAPRGPVEVYDFRRPTTLAREHARALELALETFARQWGTQLTANIRSRSQVTFVQVLMTSYDEYASSLPASTAMVLCTVSGGEAKAVIQFPTTAALTWISHMLGGDGTHAEPERILTQMEQTLVRKLVEDILDDLRYSLGPLLPDGISIDAIHHNSQFAQAAAPAELMIVASFTVQSGEQNAPATIAIPAELLLARLGEPEPVVSTVDAKSLVESQIVRVPVDVALRIPPVRISPSAVLKLSVGDVIPLGFANHKPLDIAIDGRTLAHAAVGANGPRMACVVTDIQETKS